VGPAASLDLCFLSQTGSTVPSVSSPRTSAKGYAGLRGLPLSASAPGISLSRCAVGFPLRSLARTKCETVFMILRTKNGT
jgi:hypothetical protein